ncbi:MAG: hypothetical protein HKN84_01890 [Gammaproteobacteria bacterium]|nr:hypothetical protein [Gammaproteobacteria bacterium]
MRAKIIKLLKSIDALTLRERLFVFAAMLAVVAGSWEALLASPLAAREAAAQRKIETTRQRLEELDQALQLTAQGIGGGMTGHFDRLQTLRRSVSESEESLRIFTSDLVDPAQMRLVLEDLIERQSDLDLVRAANLEVRPLIEPDEAQDEAPPEDTPTLYRHGFVLELEGSYLDCLAYLTEVEQLPWQIYWHSIRLDAQNPPRNRIVIELYTLSLEEDWIGV